MLSYLIALLSGAVYDSNGVMYQDSTFSVLELAPDSLSSYTIPASVQTIKGGSETQSAFYRCRSKLKSIKFSTNSQLSHLESYCFFKCALEGELDMSACTKLIEINYCVFAHCTFSNIIFPPNLENILSGAFFGCASITKLKFPETLKSIGGYMAGYNAPFQTCVSLSSIDWGVNPSIKSLGDNAFFQSGLTSIYIPTSMTSIAGGCFGSTKISHIEVNTSNPVYKSDGEFLMSKDGTIVYLGLQSPDGDGSVVIPNGVVLITNQAFRYSQLTGVSFPSSLTNITSYSFQGTLIKHVDLPSTITLIDHFVFANCIYLETVNFQAKVIGISGSLFAGCIKLKELILPDGIISLSTSCFDGCTSIQRIEIPESVYSIAVGVFANINRSCEIIFRGNSPMKYEEGVVYASDESTIIACVSLKTETFVIRPNVKIIGSKSFSQNTVPAIDFGQSAVTTIQYEAFKGSSLTEINIPASVISINEFAFQDCANLKSLNFVNPSNSQLTNIKVCAFKSTKISQLILPPSVVNIFDEAFANCLNLKTIELGSGNLKTIGNGCFNKCPATSLSIPSSAYNVTKGCIEGSSIATLVINGPSAMTEILECAFWKATALTSVSFSSGIEKIADSAFLECKALQTLTLPSGIKSIGIQSFRDCVSLRKVTVLPTSSLESIGGLAFYGCNLLSEFEMEANSHFKVVDGVVFNADVTNLILYLPGSPNPTFVCPSSVTSIAAYSFAGAANLANVTILNDGMSSIGYQAFLDCKSLSHVRLPAGLSQVDNDAFLGCTSLSCGSLIYNRDEALMAKLIAAGVPEVALYPCPTDAFTAGVAQNNQFCPLLFVLQSPDNE